MSSVFQVQTESLPSLLRFRLPQVGYLKTAEVVKQLVSLGAEEIEDWAGVWTIPRDQEAAYTKILLETYGSCNNYAELRSLHPLKVSKDSLKTGKLTSAEGFYFAKLDKRDNKVISQRGFEIVDSLGRPMPAGWSIGGHGWNSSHWRVSARLPNSWIDAL